MLMTWDVPPLLTVLKRDYNRGYDNPYDGL